MVYAIVLARGSNREQLKDLAEEIRRFHISLMPRGMGPRDDGGACYLC